MTKWPYYHHHHHHHVTYIMSQVHRRHSSIARVITDVSKTFEVKLKVRFELFSEDCRIHDDVQVCWQPRFLWMWKCDRSRAQRTWCITAVVQSPTLTSMQPRSPPRGQRLRSQHQWIYDHICCGRDLDLWPHCVQYCRNIHHTFKSIYSDSVSPKRKLRFPVHQILSIYAIVLHR